MITIDKALIANAIWTLLYVAIAEVGLIIEAADPAEVLADPGKWAISLGLAVGTRVLLRAATLIPELLGGGSGA